MSRGTLLSAVVASAYGFTLLRLFRYILNQFYPFWSSYISLGVFAFILAFFFWLAFFRFFPRHLAQTGFVLPRKTVLIHSLVLLVGLFSLGEKRLLYFFPVFYGLLILVQGYFLVSLLPRKIHNRSFLLAGMGVGLAVNDIPHEIILLVILSGLVFMIPKSLLENPWFGKIFHKIRLQPLRLVLDFVRFLFLGLAVYGIFDRQRSFFYLVSFLLVVGAITQELIFRYHQRKMHIRFGLFLLGPIFLLLALLLFSFPFSLVAAKGYLALSLWEAIYFRRPPEGYLRREHWLMGFIIVLLISFHFFQEGWVYVATVSLIILALIFMLFYLYRRYRQLLASLLLSALVCWIFVFVSFWQKQTLRNLWALKPQTKTSFLDPRWLMVASQAKKQFINFDFPPRTSLDKDLVFQQIPPMFITLYLSALWLTHKEESWVLFLANMKPYNEPHARSVLEDFAKYMREKEVVFVGDGQSPPDVPLDRKTQFHGLLSELAQKAFAEGEYERATFYYELILELYPSESSAYRKLADLCGFRGDIACQTGYLIRYLEKNLTKPNYEEKLLLLELYFLQGKLKEAKELAEQLLAQDRMRALTYYHWLFRILEKEGNPSSWQDFYYRVKNYPIQGEREQREKDILLEKIENALEANPAFSFIVQKEQKRQEHIVFPD
ncbi:MAG: hypothetical protein NZM25_01170 [Leptospiraceae bacterium]|nr:hypothetical protein [Leptospiraceae bacterium]MDW8306335.1 hypothetical protein [Leptospiraceae bacterium]